MDWTGNFSRFQNLGFPRWRSIISWRESWTISSRGLGEDQNLMQSNKHISVVRGPICSLRFLRWFDQSATEIAALVCSRSSLDNIEEVCSMPWRVRIIILLGRWGYTGFLAHQGVMVHFPCSLCWDAGQLTSKCHCHCSVRGLWPLRRFFCRCDDSSTD